MNTFDNTYFSRFITELLSEYECVVVPNFGGFVSHYKSATFDIGKNILLPPTIRISFNSLLNENDGLLIHELAKDLQIPFKEASILVSEMVAVWVSIFEAGKIVTIDGIGSFSKSAQGKLLFEENLAKNILADSFGLSAVKAQLIAKDGVSGKLKEEYIARKSSPVINHSIKKGVTYFLSSAAIVLIFTWTFLNFNLVNRQTESLGIFFQQNFSSKKEVLAINNPVINSDVEDPVIKDEELISNVIDVEVNPSEVESYAENTTIIESEIDNTEVTNEQRTDDIKVKRRAEGKYIIVAGCFQSIENANKYVDQLKQLGYAAHLCGESETGLVRVVYNSYNQRVEALKSLASIRLHHNTEAWMTHR